MTKYMLAAFAAIAMVIPAQAAAKDVVRLPTVPTDRVVVYVHGSGGHASDIGEGTGLSGVVDELLGQGYAVAASEAGGPQTWGDAASVTDYEHLINRLGYKEVFLLGASMGGLDTMQLMGSVHPEAVALISPVCNIRSVTVDWLQPAIDVAWGESRPSYLSPVVPDSDKGLPVLIWASPQDKLVPKALNGDVCARELRHRGARVREVTAAGEHGDPSAVRPHWVAGFFESHHVPTEDQPTARAKR